MSMSLRPGSILSNDQFDGYSFTGTTADGRPILVTDAFHVRTTIRLSSHRASEYEQFSPNRVLIGDERPVDELRYYFPDVMIGFRDFERLGNSCIRNHTRFSVQTRDHLAIGIELRPAPDLAGKPVKSKKDARKHFTVAAIISACDSGAIPLAKADEIARSLEHAIGFAVGQMRPWVICEGLRAGSTVSRRYRDVAYNTGNRFAVVRPENPWDAEAMIKRGMEFFLECKPKAIEQVARLTSGLQIASSHLVFPMPFILLASALESSIAGDEEGCPAAHIVDRHQRKSILPSFKEWLEREVIPLISNNDHIAYLRTNAAQKLNSVVAATLADRICAMLDSVRLPYDRNWVNEFVKKRNSAAHDDCRFSPNDMMTYFRMLSLVHRYVLIQMSYTGRMIDWSVSPPEDAVLTHDGFVAPEAVSQSGQVSSVMADNKGS